MKSLFGPTRGWSFLTRRILVLLVAVAMFAVMPLATPAADGQESSASYSRSEQQAAAADVMDQLNSSYGPLSLSDLDVDPALGPPPWTSFVHNRDPATVKAWLAIAQRVGTTPTVNPNNALTLPLGVPVQESEGIGEIGLNDTLGTGEVVAGFGTGDGDQPIARISGWLNSPPPIPPPPPPPPDPQCPSVEEDGSIPDANPTGIAPDIFSRLCGGVIGDGEFGETSGDVDFFEIGPATAGTTIILDAGAFPPATPPDVTLGLYLADGTLVATHDDDSTEDGDFLEYTVESDEVFYAAVAGVGTLSTDPFDPSTGTGISYVGDYFTFVNVFPPPTAEPGPAPEPPPPLSPWQQNFGAAALELAECASVEDDSSIPAANIVDVEVDSAITCSGMVGDGEFGETSGDFDFYAVGASAGDALSISTEAAALGGLDTLVAVFDSSGTLLGFNNDTDTTDSILQVFLQADGVYFVGVFAANAPPGDPFDAASGPGAATTGPYNVTIGRSVPPRDVDVYLVDLEVGDVISAGFSTEPFTQVSIVDPTGRGQGSLRNASFIVPLANPLRSIGNVMADFVVETPGQHAIVLSAGAGAYTGELKVKKAAFQDQATNDVQILFLDFDGGTFNDSIFDPFTPDGTGIDRTLSPLVDWLPRWGLDASDEDAVIEAIIAEVTDGLLLDLQESGINGNRDASGNGGEIDLRILNSRDHPDPWGQPNVSRIIVGGSIAEAGIPTIGIAQSIDPGNYDTTETALVLLDVLSEPAGIGAPSLNNYSLAPPSTKVELVGQGVGIITAHEAGHYFGNWHTTTENDVNNIMDEGGNIDGTVGIGADGIFGSADDTETELTTDEYSFREGFVGFANSAVRTAQGLSTGSVDVEPYFEGLPLDGDYTLRNVRSGQFLDADADGTVDVSNVVFADDIWSFANVGANAFTLVNQRFDRFLDGDPDGSVGQSNVPRADDLWEMIPTQAGSFLLKNGASGRYLAQVDGEIVLTRDQTDAERWIPEPPPAPVNPLVGLSIALRNDETGRWLDTDSGGVVDQSRFQRDDDVWNVLDAGDGYVYMQNAVTNRYLDADGPNDDVGTSRVARSDDRWDIEIDGEVVLLRNVDFDTYLVGLGSDAGFDVVTDDSQPPAAFWTITEIENDE